MDHCFESNLLHNSKIWIDHELYGIGQQREGTQINLQQFVEGFFIYAFRILQTNDPLFPWRLGSLVASNSLQSLPKWQQTQQKQNFRYYHIFIVRNHDSYIICKFQLMTSLSFIVILTFSFIVHAHSGSQTDHSADANTVQDLSSSQAWGFGFLAGVGLSSIGFVAAIIVVVLQKFVSEKNFKVVTNLLYALGCGAMVGDAMIHILPESYQNKAVNFRWVALIFISAIVIFIGIERLFVRCGISHQHWGEDDEEHSHHGQSHGHHAHKHKHGEHDCEGEIRVDAERVEKNENGDSPKKELGGSGQNLQLVLVKNKSSHAGSFKELYVLSGDNKVANQNQPKPNSEKKDEGQQKDEGCLQKYKGKGSAGYLNLLSSFIHNFFDGFAIGAAFASRQKAQYIPTLIAVYAHEIPREMGDVGILLKNKFNGCQTICCNGIINCISLLGVILGLGLGSISEAVQIYIMCFVAGNFIYIGADIWRNLLKNKTFCVNLAEFLSFCIGVGCMYLVLLAQA